ncbi:MAG TPA: site-specific integrase [Polyangiales bacterium]|nr:site-specific integrase [Polyangiales bacterium]
MQVAPLVRIAGPLVPYFDGFRAELAAYGYTDLSAANQLRLMADLSRWLVEKSVIMEQVDRKVLRGFLAKRRRTHTQFNTDRAIRPLLRYLEDIGVIVLDPMPDRRPKRGVLCAYERYLVEERAVLPARQAAYLIVADDFLRDKRVSTLTAADVTRTVEAHAAKPGFSGWLSSLRSLLRFLFVSSRTTTNLVYAVPSTPCWSQQSLPQSLEPDELSAVLAVRDRRTLAGCRDYAVLVLMARLGLRGCEVAALRLEDIDWKAGELTVHGKGRSLSRLPLPVDVGHAVVAYLKRSPRSTTARTVFVSCRAPYASLSPPGVVRIAHSALRAAGVSRGGSHRLRHTAATQMLRRGSSMTEVAQVLRHRHINTTAIYAKVDHASLRMLAKPWPADAPDPAHVCALAQSWPGGVR